MGHDRDSEGKIKREILKRMPWLKDEDSRQEHRRKMWRKEREADESPAGDAPEVHWASMSPQQWERECDQWLDAVLEMPGIDRDQAHKLEIVSQPITFRARQLGVSAVALRNFASAVGRYACGREPDDSSALPLLDNAFDVVDEVRDQAIANQLQAHEHQPETAEGSTAGFAHGGDFTWVRWCGLNYSFKKGQQAGVVKALWAEWEQSGRMNDTGLSAETLGEAIGSGAGKFRVDDLFRGHDAWGVMIRKTTNGTYALYSPSEPGE